MGIRKYSHENIQTVFTMNPMFHLVILTMYCLCSMLRVAAFLHLERLIVFLPSGLLSLKQFEKERRVSLSIQSVISPFKEIIWTYKTRRHLLVTLLLAEFPHLSISITL